MRGRPFEPGNKFGRGRPPGSRNKTTSKAQLVLEQHADVLIKKCLQVALQDGNTTALRLCIERLLPVRRTRMLRFKLPSVQSIRDVAAACGSVVKGVADGQLTVGEGEALASILDGRRRILETQELEGRLRALEEGQNQPDSEQEDSDE